MPIWKLKIEGDTPSDVHGVNLRESIHKIVCKLNKDKEILKLNKGKEILKGTVRNIKGTSSVEIVCEASTINHLGMLKKYIELIPEKNVLVDMGAIKIGEFVEIKDDGLDLDGFKVIREDELTEMVWALQAAGKAFFSQDDIRERNLMRGLVFEIDHIRQVIDQIDTKINHFERKINLILIENILREPPYKPQKIDDELMYDLYSLYEYCQSINMTIEKERNIDVPLDEIRKLIKRIEPKLDGIVKKKDNNIKNNC